MTIPYTEFVYFVCISVSSGNAVSILKIIGEMENWVRPTTGELQKFREKLDQNKGEIIN